MDTPRYVKAVRYGSPYFVEYLGQSDETITRLLTDLGCTGIEFIGADEYSAAIARS